MDNTITIDGDDKMKKLMIMGAGIYQVPLIKTAKRMGLYTIAVSIPGPYPGFAYADKVYYENTVDHEKVLEIAKKEQIDGILTAGTDVAVITIGRVCDEMGLTGISYEAAINASNKLIMKESYEKAGVRTARFRKVPVDVHDIAAYVEELNFPLIFKAVDTSGSRGIMRVDSPDEFEAARENSVRNTRQDYYIVEEFIEGDEFGAQAFIRNGKLEFILPHGDYVFHGDTGVPVGHYAPFDLGEDIVKDAKVQLTKAALAMGLDNCAINADFILSDGKVYVLELGGRSGATCLAELVSIYYGFDYYEKMIQVALGEEVSFASDLAVPNASKLLMSEKTGRITSITDNTHIGGNLCEVQFDYKVGDEVRAFHVGPDRIGHVITKGDTLEEAVKALDEALSEIKITVEQQ